MSFNDSQQEPRVIFKTRATLPTLPDATIGVGTFCVLTDEYVMLVLRVVVETQQWVEFEGAPAGGGGAFGMPVGFGGATVGDGVVHYAAAWEQAAANTVLEASFLRFARAGVIKNMRVVCDPAHVPGTDVLIKVRINGVDTALIATLLTGASTASGAAVSVPIAAGDKLSVSTQHQGAGTAAQAVNVTFELAPAA